MTLSIPAVILCSALGPFNTAERLPVDIVAKVHVRVAHNADKAKLFVPSQRVIHVLNWHWVSEADFKLDSPHGDYGDFLNDVEAIQQEQLAILLKLGVPLVHYEGLTHQNLDVYNERVKTLRKMKLGNSATQKIVGELVREDLLQLGSPGRCLMMSGVDAVLPGDDHDLFEKANPIRNGKIDFDKAAVKAREQAIVQLLLKQPESVIVLGGGHDLTDKLPEFVEYVRISTKAYQRVSR